MTMGISTTPSLCTLSVQLQGTVEVHNTMMKIRDGNAKDLKIRLFFKVFLPGSVENVRLCYLRLRAFRLSFAKPKLIRAKVSLTRNQSEHTWILVNIFKRGKIQVTEFWLVEMVTRVFIKQDQCDYRFRTLNWKLHYLKLRQKTRIRLARSLKLESGDTQWV